MKRISLQHFAVRAGIVVLWLLVIGMLLLLPRIHITEKNSITVFTWSGVFSQDYIQKFEQETGIKVYVSYYTSNEELLIKLRATGGHGYDLIVPSDYAVKKLLDEGLLKKLDHSKLNFLEYLNPLLLNHGFDPSNEHALPFVWELYLVGVTDDFMRTHAMPTNTWDLIFKPQRFGSDYRLIMLNDPVETILAAAYYLFGHVEALTNEQIDAVQKLLMQQSAWVEGYSNVRSDYYLGTHNAHVALAQTAELWRALRDYKGINFVVPHETFITIEHCAIPVASKKDDLVYTFLNYFYTKESFKHHFEVFRSCPARLDVIDSLDATEQQKEIMRSSPEAFKNYHLIRDIISEQRKHDLWITLKS